MQSFDVIVVGAGHAGIEAALASARLGRHTLCITLRRDRIGHLPCNCSIGGPAKGHITREVDALGGQMAVTTDYTLTHVRRVGTGKGPAVQTSRAHVCKSLYPMFMQRVMDNQENLTLMEGMVETLLGEHQVEGVRVTVNAQTETMDIAARAVILTTGTFLNGVCHRGKERTLAAREGDSAVEGLGAFLRSLGVPMRRFKTGTTPRIDLRSIDFDRVSRIESETDAGPFSFLHQRSFPRHDMVPCWQTHTNPKVHELLHDNLNESAMYSGQIEGVGPRYCPSIEDKIVRFSDKSSHPIFLEQEEWDGHSVYVQGFSSSMPEHIQLAALRNIEGLENVRMLRPGYAVEYDVAEPTELYPSLMSKRMPGLFMAGQLNGTSGYEEAAGQGLIAGINASLYVREDEPLTLRRDESFIGVMIDDLVTKGVEDPYRMLTARAEHRLLLRHDNADQRLTPISREIGLCSEQRWQRFGMKQEAIAAGRSYLQNNHITASHNELLRQSGSQGIDNRLSLLDALRRPELDLQAIEMIACKAGHREPPSRNHLDERLRLEVEEQLELAAVFEGYIQIEARLAEQARRLEDMRIPADFDYAGLTGLSYESKEKLRRTKPLTVGQASRIPGVRPSDIALLIGHLHPQRRRLSGRGSVAKIQS